MIISGKNSVYEALKGTTSVNKIQILKNARGFDEIVEVAKQNKVRFEFVERAALDKQAKNHQGVVANVTDFAYCNPEDILEYAKQKEEDAFIVILDGIEDPHNLGAIIRSCECAGVHGIIIPNRRAVPVNDTVVKTSAGAIANMRIAKVTNINQEIDKLKNEGVWVYGFEANGSNVYKTNLKGNVALVIGSEGKGISSLTQKKCDEIVSLPLFGKVNSLNASVACGIAVYEALRQRKN